MGGAGGLGFLAGGYRTPDAVADDVGRLRAASAAPFGVNVFSPVPAGDPAAVAAYAELVAPRAAARGVSLGEPPPEILQHPTLGDRWG